ncbi:MAG: peptide-methionine (S)-S-oxide reductase MsrA [Campylobacterota bacterium]|nr:peptide-methionine (S)-S-oxide reductase MsrA [Campylobacterota bacterium]
MKNLVLGGGCFWCIEAVYNRVKGVESALSGYAGGHRPNPSYQSICTGVSGHAEIVDIRYDDEVITLKELLDIFFVVHNPTTLNAQGADKGTQYRSVIYYENAEEKALIDESIVEHQAEFDDKIVTEVSKLPEVYPAEDYHQNYYDGHSQEGYCQVVIAPKLQKFMTKFPQKLV